VLVCIIVFKLRALDSNLSRHYFIEENGAVKCLMSFKVPNVSDFISFITIPSQIYVMFVQVRFENNVLGM